MTSLGNAVNIATSRYSLSMTHPLEQWLRELNSIGDGLTPDDLRLFGQLLPQQERLSGADVIDTYINGRIGGSINGEAGIDVLTLEQLEQWAKSLQPIDITGNAGNPSYCPVSFFLFRSRNYSEPSTYVSGSYGITADGEPTSILHSSAVTRLIRRIDHLTAHTPVSAKRLLDFIDNVR